MKSIRQSIYNKFPIDRCKTFNISEYVNNIGTHGVWYPVSDLIWDVIARNIDRSIEEDIYEKY